MDKRWKKYRIPIELHGKWTKNGKMVGEGGEMHALMKVRVLQDIVPIGAVAQKGNRVSCI